MYSVICIKCGKKLEEGTLFCDACGTRQPSPSQWQPSKLGNIFFYLILCLITIGFIFLLLNCVPFPLVKKSTVPLQDLSFLPISSIEKSLSFPFFHPFLFPFGIFLLWLL
ncbi:MAG: zinc ribbon domain-containing protein [Clostridium sp.]